MKIKNIGTSLMLVIFLTLCMIIFSVLSLSTALKDQEYSQKNAKSTAEYYAACNAAEEKIAGILSDNLPLPTEFSVPVSETKTLLVELDEHGEIITWQQISTADWNETQTLPVLGSE